MPSSDLRIGFVGAGCQGQSAHLRHYAFIDGARIVALAELRENTGREVARRYGIPTFYSTAEQMLANESLDAIVAVQPFSRHGIILRQLLQSRLPIFIEKPLAASVPVAQQIIEQLTQSDSRVMVGYHKLSDPATIYAKAQIDQWHRSNECGRMRYARITMPSGDWVQGAFVGFIDAGDPIPQLPLDPAPTDMDERAFEAYSGFVNFFIHQVNLMRHLIGDDYRLKYADSSGVLLVGEGEQTGVTCVIEMDPYRTTRMWEESARVCFERGYVALELPAPLEQTHAGRVTVFRDAGDGQTPMIQQPVLPTIPAMRQQAMNFLAFARGEAEAPCDALDAFKDLLIAQDYINYTRELHV